MFPRISTPSVASLVLQGPGRSHGCHHFTGRKKQTPQPQVFCPSRGGKQSSQLESLGNFGSYKPSGSQLRGCMGIRRESSKYLLIGYIATQFCFRYTHTVSFLCEGKVSGPDKDRNKPTTARQANSFSKYLRRNSFENPMLRDSTFGKIRAKPEVVGSHVTIMMSACCTTIHHAYIHTLLLYYWYMFQGLLKPPCL